MSPLFSEYVSFTIEESKTGVFVSCTRVSKGLFSFLSLFNWSKNKSKILERLADITPVIEKITETEKSETLSNIITYTSIKEGVANTDLVVEAATENLNLKLKIFK